VDVEFKVETDVFTGPMDLLLYLVKKHEVDATEVPIARITADFLAHLDVLEALAIDQVGDFVDLATVLLEIKARSLVPRPEEEAEETVEPVREDLVQRLLEYRQFRDAAALLEDRARQWDLRFSRLAPDAAAGPEQRPEVTIADAQVWDLVGALGRVLVKREKRRPRQIVHDDTPQEVHAARIEALVLERGRLAFTELFDDDMSRSRVVGLFLAVLELVRRGRLTTHQDGLFGDIWLGPVRASEAPPIADRLRLHDDA
jgi:segregation and condensation protein A